MVLFADRFADAFSTLLLSLFSAIVVADLISTIVLALLTPPQQRARSALDKSESAFRNVLSDDKMLPIHNI